MLAAGPLCAGASASSVRGAGAFSMSTLPPLFAAALPARSYPVERREHVVQHECEPLPRIERVEHDEQRGADGVGEKRFAFGIDRPGNRLGRRRLQRVLSARLPRTQHVEADPRPIGVIRSALKERSKAPKQGAEGAPDAWLEVRAWAAKALNGLLVGDEISYIL